MTKDVMGLVASAALLTTTVAGNALNAAGFPEAAIPVFITGLAVWGWLFRRARARDA
jgi:hypothetical protein